MKSTHLIDPGDHLTAHQLTDILNSGKKLELSENARNKISKCRAYLDSSLPGKSGAIYGINTGFGSLCNTVISENDLEQLQRNLLLSHACGMGDEVPAEIVRRILILKIQGLSYGHSGVQLETVQRLCDFYNLDILPVIYEQGSLGASGDLAPLAHLSLPLIGEGTVLHQKQYMPAHEVLRKYALAPIALKSKEGLALINGTQFMSSYASWCVSMSWKLLQQSLVVAAMSLDAFDGRPEPFDPLTHRVRRQAGQGKIAAAMLKILEGSSLLSQEKAHVQDPYSFRCIPQVLGAIYQSLNEVTATVTSEINSVTDNPLVFPDEGKIISGGNFHGQPLAMSLDYLAIAMAELGSISERRIYKLISGQRGLPAFLVSSAGLNSGFMIPQYTAASIVSQNKQLCSPSSIDTIDSSNGQEDHVSMGANSATKCYRVLKNTEKIIGIELMNAAQALEFRRPGTSSSLIEEVHGMVRKEVPFISDDVFMQPLMSKCIELLGRLPLVSFEE